MSFSHTCILNTWKTLQNEKFLSNHAFGKVKLWLTFYSFRLWLWKIVYIFFVYYVFTWYCNVMFKFILSTQSKTIVEFQIFSKTTPLILNVIRLICMYCDANARSGKNCLNVLPAFVRYSWFRKSHYSRMHVAQKFCELIYYVLFNDYVWNSRRCIWHVGLRWFAPWKVERINANK